MLLRSVEIDRRPPLDLDGRGPCLAGSNARQCTAQDFDRLLSSRHLYGAHEQVYTGMAHWLLRSTRPVIVIDWSDIKPDRSWCLLRAAIPVGGRTLPVLDMIFPGKHQGTPSAEEQFLKRLAALMPTRACPILVTDAGFRNPWFREVTALGWDWVGRLRGTTQVKPVAVADRENLVRVDFP